MAGFMSTSTAMRIFNAPVEKELSELMVRAQRHAFRSIPPTPGPDGRRVGWVGLGDPLDLDFVFGPEHRRYFALSLRVDTRKPSGAAIRIKLAEALREEAAASPEGKITGKRKKELKEAITASVTAKTEFIPALVDCLWDLEKGRLLLSSTSEPMVALALEVFERTFGVSPAPITPIADMAKVFEEVFTNDGLCNGVSFDGYPEPGGMWGGVYPDAYAVTLASPEQQDERAAASVKNNRETGEKALENGLKIKKMGIRLDIYESVDAHSAGDISASFSFMLDDSLAVSGLKLPKGDKDSDPEADFFLKAENCFLVAKAVELIGESNGMTWWERMAKTEGK